MHERTQVLGIVRRVIHVCLPLRKRERVGLSAGGAYNGRSTDSDRMGAIAQKRNEIARRTLTVPVQANR